MSEEIWVDIKDYEGIYQVSNFGRVKSLDRYHPKRRGIVKGKILSNTINSRGYYGVKLCGKRKNIHRLVADNFIPNPENKPEVNHKDGDKLFNHDSNLEWSTHSENIQHSKDVLGKGRGSRARKAILNEEQVKEIKLLIGLTNFGDAEIGKVFGVPNYVIHKIKRGKNWAWLDEKGLFTSCNH